jgi:hypothetical protein
MVVCEAANSRDLSSQVELRVAFRKARLGTPVVTYIDKHVDDADLPVDSNSSLGWGIKERVRAIKALSHPFVFAIPQIPSLWFPELPELSQASNPATIGINP